MSPHQDLPDLPTPKEYRKRFLMGVLHVASNAFMRYEYTYYSGQSSFQYRSAKEIGDDIILLILQLLERGHQGGYVPPIELQAGPNNVSSLGFWHRTLPEFYGIDGRHLKIYLQTEWHRPIESAKILTKEELDEDAKNGLAFYNFFLYLSSIAEQHASIRQITIESMINGVVCKVLTLLDGLKLFALIQAEGAEPLWINQDASLVDEYQNL